MADNLASTLDLNYRLLTFQRCDSVMQVSGHDKREAPCGRPLVGLAVRPLIRTQSPSHHNG